MVIAEIKKLAAEYLDRDELEQKIEFCDTLKGQKKRLTADLHAYERKAAEYSKGIRELYLDKVKGFSPRTIMWRCPGTLSRNATVWSE